MTHVAARSLSPAGAALLAVALGGGLWAGTRAPGVTTPTRFSGSRLDHMLIRGPASP